MLAYSGLAVLGGWGPAAGWSPAAGTRPLVDVPGVITFHFLRWHGYLRALGAQVPLGRDLLIYVASFDFTVTPGKAGEAVRSVYLRASGVPWSPGLAALAVEGC